MSATLLKKRLSHRYFHVNFWKIFRTRLLQNTSGRLLLHFQLEQLLQALVSYVFITNCAYNKLIKLTCGFHAKLSYSQLWARVR